MVKLSQILLNRGIFSKDIKSRLKNGQIKINGIVEKDNIEIPINPTKLELHEFDPENIFMDLGDLIFKLVSNPIWELQLRLFGAENLILSNVQNSLTKRLDEFIIIRTAKNKAFVIIKDT